MPRGNQSKPSCRNLTSELLWSLMFWTSRLCEHPLTWVNADILYYMCYLSWSTCSCRANKEHRYTMEISTRLGRTRYKEQYLFLYRWTLTSGSTGPNGAPDPTPFLFVSVFWDGSHDIRHQESGTAGWYSHSLAYQWMEGYFPLFNIWTIFFCLPQTINKLHLSQIKCVT